VPVSKRLIVRCHTAASDGWEADCLASLVKPIIANALEQMNGIKHKNNWQLESRG